MQPQVMGIVNITPDSFSDGGKTFQHEAALRHALLLVEEGASILDIGGESSRPGASPVSVQEELDRVIPFIEKLKQETAVRLSVDTSKPEVMRAALDLSVWMINDIYALHKPGALEAAAASSAQVCLMHMQGTPETMQQSPHYPRGVVPEIQNFFTAQLQRCEKAGIAKERLWLDPGFGFGKTLNHNLALLKHIKALKVEGRPLVVGVSRKSLLGEIIHQPIDKRLYAGLAVAAFVGLQGIQVIRTHAVRPTCELLKVLEAITGYTNGR